jgi:hypothetical protein
MPASLTRHPDYENALVMTISGNVAMGEALDATEQESVLIQESDRLLHTIIDLSESSGAPSSFISKKSGFFEKPDFWRF